VMSDGDAYRHEVKVGPNCSRSWPATSDIADFPKTTLVGSYIMGSTAKSSPHDAGPCRH
jgi:hypothetical protein